MKKIYYIILLVIVTIWGCGDISDKPSSFDILSFLDKMPEAPKGGIVLVSPISGEVSSVPIIVKWVADTNVIKKVKISLFDNISNQWKIVGNNINASLRKFNIMNVPQSNCTIKIKVASAINDSIHVVSKEIFYRYTLPRLLITSPIAGNEYEGGQFYYITWSYNNEIANSNDYFDIFYSFDKNDWKLITSTRITYGSYYWLMPSVTTPTDCYLRMVNQTNSSISYTMQSPFKIIPAVNYTITQPTLGTEWEAGSSYLIEWNSKKSYIYTNIYYSLDSLNWVYISQTNSYSGTNSYYWTIPSTLKSNKAFIKLETSNDSKEFTISKRFIIKPQAPYKITSPTSGSEWASGGTYTINWKGVKSTTVSIYYKLNTNTWNLIATGINSSEGDNAYLWTIPQNISSDSARIKIQNSNLSTEYGISEKFKIIKLNPIKVLNPTQNSVWNVGNTYTIEWDKSTATWVKVEYTSNNGNSWNTIVNSTSATSYSWTIPNTLSSGTYKIRVSDYYNDVPAGISEPFQISAASVKFVSPLNSVSIKANSNYTIQWTAKDIDYLNCEFSSDNGTNWTKVFENQVAYANGTYQWTVPNISSSNCKLKIYDNANPSIKDEVSLTVYKPLITFTAPAAGAIWIGGTQRTIQWTSKYMNRINIEYSTDGGSNWNTIITFYNSPDGSNSYSWIVPTLSQTYTNCKIRIVDYNDYSTYFISPTFTIQKP